MTVFVDCYDKDGRQILGMNNGQTVINAKQYKRTDAYKNAIKHVGKGRVHRMQFVDMKDTILEVITAADLTT